MMREAKAANAGRGTLVADGKSEPLVAVVILNTNRREDSLECLASLRNSSYSNWKAIVLDNASTDGSVEAFRQEFPEAEILQLGQNFGYAGNNNVGIRAAMFTGACWVLLLNEDTVVAPDFLSRLVDAGEADSRIGVVGPMVYHYNEPAVIQSAGGKLDRFWRSIHIGQNEEDRGQFREPRPVDWVSGCAIMVRTALLEEIGGLDERYFYYWEETEWCIRARGKGWRVVHVPQARLWHKGVQRDYRPGPSVTYYNTRNRLLTLAKHRAPLLAWAGACMQMARTLISWTARPMWRDKRQHRVAMWQGIADFLRGRWGQRPNADATRKEQSRCTVT